MERNKLPLRIGVGAIVLNKKNKVFVGKRKDNPVNKWQMPQGGVDKNETLIDAMRRELKEETSIKNIEILKELKDWTESLLSKQTCDNHGLFNFNVINKYKNEHFSNHYNHEHKLWSIIQFNQWYIKNKNYISR